MRTLPSPSSRSPLPGDPLRPAGPTDPATPNEPREARAPVEPIDATVGRHRVAGRLLEPAELAALASAVAAADAAWRPLLRHDPARRWYTRLYGSPEVEVWLLAWSAGQETTLHDHGGVAGAFHVVEGVLTEDHLGSPAAGGQLRRRSHGPGAVVAFGPAHVHNVLALGPAAATSVHAYSPPLRTMGFYDLGGEGAGEGALMETHRLVVGDPGDGAADPRPTAVPVPRAAPGVDALLAAARGRLRRLTPHEAAAAAAEGALLVDIRPLEQRRAYGEVPGAMVIDRNVLEWRLDPASATRLPQASHDRAVILLCQQGYASSLAAVTLQDLGVTRATDVVGGFEAWAEAGLPVGRG